ADLCPRSRSAGAIRSPLRTCLSAWAGPCSRREHRKRKVRRAVVRPVLGGRMGRACWKRISFFRREAKGSESKSADLLSVPFCRLSRLMALRVDQFRIFLSVAASSFFAVKLRIPQRQFIAAVSASPVLLPHS